MNYYNEIKKELIDNEIYKRVKDYSMSKYELEKYYNVGKLLVEAQGGETRAKYGDGLIKEYSTRLMLELGRRYDVTTLKRMRQFYLIIKNGAPMVHQLTWSHYLELLPLKDINKICYYIDMIIKNNLSKRDLRNRIKLNEYERLDDNVKRKLIKKENNSINDFIKHPIVIKNKYNYTDISERMLKQLILEDITSFMKELGDGYSFIDSEYKIKLGDRYNYIDILLFNIKYNCYVVVELKVTELKKEHEGQIRLYMNYIDENVKTIYHDKTIGIIIAKYDNQYVVRYCSNPRIYNTTYELV